MIQAGLQRGSPVALVSELKRRNVFRAALLYLVSSWLLVQMATLLAGALSIDWMSRFVFAMLVICFPLSMIFSYLFEITPEGLKRERNVVRERSITAQTGRKIARLTRIVFLLAVGLQVIRWIF